jgi:phosphoglycerate dehydrogenase-like enzyme
MSRGAWHILFADPFDDATMTRAESAGRVTRLDSPDAATLRKAVKDCHALVVRTATSVTRDLIEAAPQLRVIGRGGVGLDNIDLEASAERGITVVYTPHAATDSVADLTLGLMLALLRDLPRCDRTVREGAWRNTRDALCVRELHECTVGIVGMGRIGRAVARRCRHGFGCRILYNDIVDVGWLEVAAERASKIDLYAAADIVSLHVPLTDATRNLIDAEALARFKPGVLLINTARGAVVDSGALADALNDGRLAGAGLDVLDVEPPPADHPLLTTPNCVLTPHVGARSACSLARMNDVIDDVIRVLHGETPQYAYAPPTERSSLRG